MRQTINGAPTRYTLDLNAGLTQVLADGTNTYLYGNGRIVQYVGTTPSYFLGDALGSVRQMTSITGGVTLAKSYEPYGEVLSSTGSGAGMYGFTGEQTDNTSLVFLRARYYAPGQGRFITADPSRQERNLYWYSLSDPVNRVDHSGLFSKEAIASSLGYPHFYALLQAEISKPIGHRRWGLIETLLNAENDDVVYTRSYGISPIGISMGFHQSVILSDDCGNITARLNRYANPVSLKDWSATVHEDGGINLYTLVKQNGRITQYLTGPDDGLSSVPDFFFYSGSASGVFAEGGVIITVDRFGNIYISGETGVGVSISTFTVPSVGFGYVNTLSSRRVPASENDVVNTLSGFCISSTGSIVVGGSASICQNGGTILTIYFASSIGGYGTGSFTVKIGKVIGVSWDWLIDLQLNEGTTVDKLLADAP